MSTSKGIAQTQLNQPSGGGGGTPAGSIGAIAQNSLPANINLSTAGLEDWVTLQVGISGTGINFIETYIWKAQNGYLAKGILWGQDAVRSAATEAGSGSVPLSTNADDAGTNVNGATIPLVAYKEFIEALTGATGVQPNVPTVLTLRTKASRTTKTFNVIAGVPICASAQTLRMTAHLSDQSTADVNAAFAYAAGVTVQWNLFTVTFKAGAGECDFLLKIYQNTADLGTVQGRGVAFQAAWV